MSEANERFPENSAVIASDQSGILGLAIVFLLLILALFLFDGYILGNGGVFTFKEDFLLFGLSLILFGVAPVAFWNKVKPIREVVEAALTDFRNSKRRKQSLVDTVNTLAQRLSSAEYATHHGIANNAREAAAEIARGGSAAVVLANLAAQYPSLNSSTSFQSAQESAVRVEQQIDDDLRRVNRLISGYNEIVTAFPTVLFGSILGFARMDYLSDELFDPRSNSGLQAVKT